MTACPILPTHEQRASQQVRDILLAYPNAAKQSINRLLRLAREES